MFGCGPEVLPLQDSAKFVKISEVGGGLEVFQCVPFQPPADREAFSFSFRVVRAVRVVRAKLCVRVSVISDGEVHREAKPDRPTTFVFLRPLSSVFRLLCFCAGRPLPFFATPLVCFSFFLEVFCA